MSMTSDSAYRELLERYREVGRLRSIMHVLSWDEQVNLPRQGTAARADQLGYLMGMAHAKTTAPEIDDLLRRVEQSDLVADPHGDAGTNAREWRRVYDRYVRVPQALVEELERQIVLAQGIWGRARAAADFGQFSKTLETLVRLRKEFAGAIDDTRPAYDVLIEEFEPGMTEAELDRILGGLREGLVPLLEAILGSPRQPDLSLLTRDYPVDRQAIFGQAAAAAIGFDFTAGRLDIAPHPFCSDIAPGDTRMCTRYDSRRFNEGFFGIVHEAGHGLYDQGLPAEHWGTPCGHAAGMGIHESQSRMWENCVGRSRAFWEHFFPRAQQMFPGALAGVSLDDFHFAVNAVERSWIRVEADEATYDLHILLRFELERAIFADRLDVKDVPTAWNEKFHAYFGMTPPDDALGCLQDIHWSGAAFGYFPSYSLGNIYAAELYAEVQREIPDLERGFARGEFAPLLVWMRERVHAEGMRYRGPELVEKITGHAPDSAALVAQLRQRFAELYDI